MSAGRFRRASRLTLASCAAALTLLALPASGFASTATLDAGIIDIQGLPGEHNEITVAIDGADVVITDEAGVETLPTSCDQITPREVRCELAGVTFVNIVAGDESDSISNTTTLRVAMMGGPGEDSFFPVGTGPDQISGGDGTDFVSYAARTESVSVTPGVGLDDDGAPSEGDFVMEDVEGASGGEGDDLLGVAGLTDGFLVGGPGDDVLIGADTDDTLLGGDGDDRLVGGGGLDVLNGELGEDRLESRDGLVDFVNCGDDADTAQVDAAEVPVFCEVVELPDVVGPPRTPGGDTPRTPGGDTPRAPLDTTAPATTVKGVAGIARDGTVSVKVSCDEGCAGTLSLVSAKKVRVTARARAALLRLGSKRFTLASAGTATVKVRLSAKHRALLKRLRKLGVKATVTVADAGGNSRTAVTAFTATAPRR